MPPRYRTDVKLPKLPVVKLPKEPPGWNRTEVSIFTRPLPQVENYRNDGPAGEPPEWWKRKYPSGTKPEWAVWWGLLNNKMEPDRDFIFQASLPGINISAFSTIDFLLPDIGIGIEVQGKYWHYNLGSERIQRDIERTDLFLRYGITIIHIDEPDAISNPKHYVAEALRGIDHSRLARRY